MRGTIFILTGPSGVGKTTVAAELLKHTGKIQKVVTCTTRPPREGEQDGIDYHFLDHATFEKHIEQDDMLEWARVYENYYGSRKQDVEDLLTSGQHVLFVVDVQGAKTIKEAYPDAQVIFLNAESREVILNRIDKRDQGRTVNLEERIKAADVEFAYAKEADHEIANLEGKLEETVKNVLSLIPDIDVNT